jgi:hypothetical protein
MKSNALNRAALAAALALAFSAPSFAGGQDHRPLQSSEGSNVSATNATAAYDNTQSAQSEETTRIDERRLDGRLAPNTTPSDAPRAATAPAPQASPSAGYQGSNTAAASGTSGARGATMDTQSTGAVTASPRLHRDDAEHQPTVNTSNLDRYGPSLTGADTQFGNFGPGSNRAE